MFQMMNEARIGVGMGAVMLGYAGYLYSLDYARERPQGRLPRQRRPQAPRRWRSSSTPMCKRMLLTQKAYVEGAFDLGLYAARLFDDTTTLESETRAQAGPRTAGPADAHRQILALGVLPEGQRTGDPDPRRPRLHPRIPGGAVLPRQPPEPDP